MMQEQEAGVLAAFAQLASVGISVVQAAEWSDEQRNFLQTYFSKEILPVSRRWRSRNCILRRGCPGCNGTWPRCSRGPRAKRGSP